MEHNDVYTFANGMPGFEDYTKFRLIRDTESYLAQLISVDNDQIGFILIEPMKFFTDYLITLDNEVRTALGLDKTKNNQPEVWAVLTNNSDLRKVTVNLRAPVLLNRENRVGIQWIMPDEKYLTRHRLPLAGLQQEGVND